MFMLVAIFAFAIVTTSCKESKKETEKHEMHEEHNGAADHDATHEEGAEDKVAEAVFACPMDCEDGKTYTEAGTCPECKMDLKEKPADKEMKHAEGCKCQEDGECTCENGKCKCMSETASVEKECTKCEPGACKCKA